MIQLLNFIMFMVRHLDPSNLHAAVKYIMIMLYMPSEMAGYETLIVTVPTYYGDREQRMTKELYPKVGRKLGVTWEKVEKDIRDVIKKGWDRRDVEVWWPFFPQKKQPPNRQFIARMADVLDLWQMVVKAGKMKVQ